MTLSRTRTFTQIAAKAGIHSLASAGLLTQAELYRLVQSEASALSAGQIYVEAQQARKDALIVEKRILTRASPLLPRAIKLGLRQPGASLRDYEEWFGDRAAQYANPGDVASMFSPAAYLTVLYREARHFYPETSEWHIDQRRPDLANLVLSQENMNTEVSALSLVNEIMLTKVRAGMQSAASSGVQEEGGITTDDAVLQMLAQDVRSSGTPWHYYHAHLRQARALKDPTFSQLTASPAVTRHLSDATLAAIYYDIPPALYRLLTDDITPENAADKYKLYFGSLPPELLINPTMLHQWYGLRDEELQAFIGGLGLGNWQSEGEKYVDNTLVTKVGETIYRLSYMKTEGYDHLDYAELYPLSDGNWELRIRHNNSASENNKVNLINVSVDGKEKIRFDSQTVGDPVLILGKEYIIPLKSEDIPAGQFKFSVVLIAAENLKGFGYIYQYSLQQFNPVGFILKLNKAIRLYKATGLSARVLEDIVNSVNPEQITDETLSLLFHTALLMKQYALSHEEALVMARGNLSQSAHPGEGSQFDRLFNTPPLAGGGFGPSDKVINFALDNADSDAEIKATLKRAYQTDDAGLAELYHCRHHASEQPTMALTLSNLSQMYTLSLWARLHGLTPAELHQLLILTGLPDDLSAAAVPEWNRLLNGLQSVTRWLSAHGWGVQELLLMTRDVTAIPASAEISNFLMQLQALITASPSHPPLAEKISLLAPLITASFNLNSDHAAQALLRWADKAQPGNIGIDGLWSALSAAETATFDPATVASGYGLAQMALIYHASGITADAFVLFVDQPTALDSHLPADVALPRSLAVIMALSAAAHWLKTLPDSAGAGGALVAALSSGGVSAALLARATGISEALIAQAMSAAQAQADIADATKLVSYQETGILLQWGQLAAAFGVMPGDISRLLTLNYASDRAVTDDWASWKQVANAFSAGLTPLQVQAAEDAIAPGFAAALSGWLDHNEKRGMVIQSRAALYHYLLADNLNGPQVKTSRLAAAVEALQSFMHRTLAQPEGADFNAAALSSAFMLDWRQWNGRYSSWAGGQQLIYYPENYIDPTVRLGQTQMMSDMLQVLGQAQINTDTVGDAFMGYLSGFEAVANLETVNGYHDSRDVESGKTWFIGCSEAEPRTWWWRTVDQGKRAQDGLLPANAWSGWETISTALRPWQKMIRPVIYKARLYLVWVEQVHNDAKRDAEGHEIEQGYRWELKVSGKRYDGSWSTAITKDLTQELQVNKHGLNTLSDNIACYVSAWPKMKTIFVVFYDKTTVANTHPTGIFGYKIYEDMHVEKLPENEMNETMEILRSQLELEQKHPVIMQFAARNVEFEDALSDEDGIPDGYNNFNVVLNQKSIVTTAEDGKYYDLSISFDCYAEKKSLLEIAMTELLFKYYPELLTSKQEVNCYYSPDGIMNFCTVDGDDPNKKTHHVAIRRSLFPEHNNGTSMSYFSEDQGGGAD